MIRRIAMISDHASPLTPPGGIDSGGQNIYVGQLTRHLCRKGYTVDVFTRRASDSVPLVQPYCPGGRVINVPAGPAAPVAKEDMMPLMDEFCGWMLDYCRTQEPYDIVHANFWMSGMAALRLMKELSLPFVITFHALGRIRLRHQQGADRFPRQRLDVEDELARLSPGIIAECPQDRIDLIAEYRTNSVKIAVIPCGFDPAELMPVPRRMARIILGLPQRELIVLQLGRIVPRKGLETGIRGFARFLRCTPGPARMIIVGGDRPGKTIFFDPEVRRLRRIALEEGVADNVGFMGQAGREELKYYYSAADVFLSLPWYEPFGMTPVEAMACGIPVIGTDTGGIKFTVQDRKTGYLVDPRDSAQVSEALRRLVDDPGLARCFGRTAIARANGLFVWDNITAAVARFYENVARRWTGRSPETDRGRVPAAALPEADPPA